MQQGSLVKCIFPSIDISFTDIHEVATGSRTLLLESMVLLCGLMSLV